MTAEPTATSTPAATLNPAAGYTDLPGWIVFEHFGQAPDGSTDTLDFDNRMIWLVKADGSGLHELAPGMPPDGKTSPDISPDGTHVAFSTWEPLGQVWEAPIDGGAPQLLTTDCSGEFEECQEHEPAYSADGTSLAIVRLEVIGGEPVTQLAVRDLADGSLQTLESTRMPLSEGYVSQPSWSPDGTEIVYYRVLQPSSADRPTGTQVLVAAADDSGVRELPLPDAGWAADPDWSPDGESIVFSTAPNREIEGWSNFPGHDGIWTISPDGSGLTRLNLVGWAPSWTPDGRRIMFWGIRSWAMMDADGGNVAHINQPELTWFGEELGYGYAGFLQPTR